MVYAGILAQAFSIALNVYGQIPKERKHPYFRTLMWMAEEIYQQIYDQTFPPKRELMVVEQPATQSNFAEEVLRYIFSVPIRKLELGHCYATAFLSP